MGIRDGRDGDLADVGRLHQRSRVAAYAHLIEAEALEARTAEGFAEWWVERWKWERDTHRLTVAEDDGRIVGFTYVGPSETEGAHELYAIHVEPDRVGSGVGRELMVNALAQLRESGGRSVLWVLEGNTVARRFYERGGWQADGGERVEPLNDTPVRMLRYSYML